MIKTQVLWDTVGKVREISLGNAMSSFVFNFALVELSQN